MRKFISILIFIIFSLLLTSCGNVRDTSLNDKLTIAVTILPEEAFVKAVCGDLVNVITMVPPGSSPENYEPTPVEMENFSKSVVYFTIGVPTEKANILSKTENMKVIDLSKEVSAIYPDREFSEGERDPHIWLSPKRAKIMVEAIAREMAELDKANEEIYQANAKNYIERLDKLDGDIKIKFQDIRDKKFITFHPAYGYFADDYGLEMYSFEHEGKEATPQDLQNTIDFAKANNIKILFYQPEVSVKQLEAFTEEIGGTLKVLDPLSVDYIANLQRMADEVAGAMKGEQ